SIILAVFAYVTLSRKVIRPLDEVSTHFEQMAKGDLTQRIEMESDDEMGRLYHALKQFQDSLGRAVAAVRQGMVDIAAGSQRILSDSTDLSSRTEQQAAALQQTAASMEQLS